MIQITKPDYWVTVGNAYFKDDTMTDTQGVSTIKKVGIQDEESETKIYGSGNLYAVLSQHSSTTISIDAIEIPRDWINRFLGHEMKNGFSVQSNKDRPVEFSFGYTIRYSNGEAIYRWYPRCQLSSPSDEIESSTDSPTDPSHAYQIIAMPSDDGTIRLEYDGNSEAAKGKKITEEDFFKQVIKSINDPAISNVAGA